ncbi:MAG: hypothetical protein ACLUAR_03170 [Pilosibacter sp.]
MMTELTPASFKDWSTVYLAFMRLVALPFLALFIMRLLNADPIVTGCAVILTAMPAGSYDGASGGEIWIGSGVCVEMSAYQYTVLSDYDSDHDIIYMRVLCAGGTCPALTEAERRCGST